MHSNSVLKDEIQEAKDALEEILKLCTRCNTQEDHRLIYKAFDVALEAHKGVRRKSGELYIMHPLAVARIVAEEIGLG